MSLLIFGRYASLQEKSLGENVLQLRDTINKKRTEKKSDINNLVNEYMGAIKVSYKSFYIFSLLNGNFEII